VPQPSESEFNDLPQGTVLPPRAATVMTVFVSFAACVSRTHPSGPPFSPLQVLPDPSLSHPSLSLSLDFVGPTFILWVPHFKHVFGLSLLLF